MGKAVGATGPPEQILKRSRILLAPTHAPVQGFVKKYRRLSVPRPPPIRTRYFATSSALSFTVLKPNPTFNSDRAVGAKTAHFHRKITIRVLSFVFLLYNQTGIGTLVLLKHAPSYYILKTKPNIQHRQGIRAGRLSTFLESERLASTCLSPTISPGKQLCHLYRTRPVLHALNLNHHETMERNLERVPSTWARERTIIAKAFVVLPSTRTIKFAAAFERPQVLRPSDKRKLKPRQETTSKNIGTVTEAISFAR